MPKNSNVPENQIATHILYAKKFVGLNFATIAVIATKGGDGKSTSAISLGRLYAAAGYKVLFFDIDEQCSTTMNLYADFLSDERNIVKAFTDMKNFEKYILQVEENIFLVPGSDDITDQVGIPHEKIQIAINGMRSRDVHFDICIIDTPGSWGVFCLVGAKAADYIISPARIDAMFSQHTINKLKTRFTTHMRDALKKWHVVLTYTKKRNKAHEMSREMYQLMDLPLLDIEIPDSAKIKNAQENCIALDPSMGVAFTSYADLAYSILETITTKE